jgi:hypothetical protein
MTCRLIPLLAGTLLCACASDPVHRDPVYPEPPSTPSAKVRFKNLQVERYYMAINAADPEKCLATSMVGWLNGGRELDTQRVRMLDSEAIKPGILERHVPAGKSTSFAPFVVPQLDAFTILTGMGISKDHVIAVQSGACETPVFVPKAGEEYEILYDPSPGACRVTLVRLSAGPDGKVLREDLTKTATGSVAHVPGTYRQGIPKVTCKKF